MIYSPLKIFACALFIFSLTAHPMSASSDEWLEPTFYNQKEIDLSGKISNHSEEEYEVIARHIKAAAIEKINISNNKFADENCFEILVRAFVNHATLRKLTVHNSLDSATSCTLLKALSEAPTELIHLDLSHNPEVSIWGFLHLGEVLEKNQKLESLNLSFTYLSKVASSSVARGLIKNRSLKALHLSNTDLTASGFREVISCLNLNITHLDFSHNPIGNEGAITIAVLLSEGCNIQYLNLAHCQLTDTGLIKIVRGCMENKKLRELHLTGNKFDCPQQESNFKDIINQLNYLEATIIREESSFIIKFKELTFD